MRADIVEGVYFPIPFPNKKAILIEVGNGGEFPGLEIRTCVAGVSPGPEEEGVFSTQRRSGPAQKRNRTQRRDPGSRPVRCST